MWAGSLLLILLRHKSDGKIIVHILVLGVHIYQTWKVFDVEVGPIWSHLLTNGAWQGGGHGKQC